MITREMPRTRCNCLRLNVSHADFEKYLTAAHSKCDLYVGRVWGASGIRTGLFNTQKEALTSVLKYALKWKHSAPTEKEMLDYAKSVVASPDCAMSLSQSRHTNAPGFTALDDDFVTVMRAKAV